MKKHKTTFLLLLLLIIISSGFACSRNNQFDQEILLTSLDSIKYKNNNGIVLINEPKIAVNQVSFPLIGANGPSKLKTNL